MVTSTVVFDSMRHHRDLKRDRLRTNGVTSARYKLGFHLAVRHRPATIRFPWSGTWVLAVASAGMGCALPSGDDTKCDRNRDSERDEDD